MVPTLVKTDERSVERTESEVAAVLVHLKKLLRLKNRLLSPLLRLPTEIIVHILSYLMEDVEYSSVRRSVFSTCHHIRNIMCTAPELWQKADFTSDRNALVTFARSQGNLQAIIADLLAWGDWRDDYARNALSFCRDNLVLHGHKMRALDVRGYPSDIINFSWIFERSLPRLEYVKIHFSPPWVELSGYSMEDPVILQLPADLPLRVLDLTNATLPWSSYLFTELRELHLDFTECDSFVEITEEELLGILDAPPQLESLSLIRLIPKVPVVNNQQQYTPTRIVKLTSLTSLDLDSFPMLVGYILAHMDIPAIDSLKIRADFSPWAVELFFDHFPDHILPGRLFSNPPIFEIWPDLGYGNYESVKAKIGSTRMQFDFDMDEDEGTFETIMACVLSLVPPSVTALRLDHPSLDKDEWTEFFQSHAEVRSIKSSSSRKGFGALVSEPLWDALSPAGAGAVTLCPKLESISLSYEPISTPLLDCLLNRKIAGYGLKHLTLRKVDDKSAEKLRLLVEELQVVAAPDESVRRVRRVLRDKMDHVLTISQWGNRSPPEESWI